MVSAAVPQYYCIKTHEISIGSSPSSLARAAPHIMAYPPYCPVLPFAKACWGNNRHTRNQIKMPRGLPSWRAISLPSSKSAFPLVAHIAWPIGDPASLQPRSKATPQPGRGGAITVVGRISFFFIIVSCLADIVSSFFC